MLSETYLLWQALDRAGIKTQSDHPRVKPPGSSAGPFLRARLDSEGSVTTVEDVTGDEWAGFWTTREGNQTSFPVVRIKEPLFDIPRSSDVWSELGFDAEGKRKKPPGKEKRLSILSNAVVSDNLLLPPRSQRFWRRLRDKASEFLQHTGSGAEEYAALPEFARCFQKAADDPRVLLKKIAESALQGVKQARLDAFDVVEMLLVGKGPPNSRGKRPQMSIQLAFDLQYNSSFGHRLYSREVREHVERNLPERADGQTIRNSKRKHPANTDAYTGKEQPLQITPFPTVRLPVLNKEFPLVSMFSDAQCNKRYGLTDAFIVPVAQETAKRMQGALKFIVDKNRKGKTWRGVANGKFETKSGRKKALYDLFIVYVDGKPEINANIADLFGTDERIQQKQFEVDAQAVCKALDGIEKQQPGSRLNLFLLRKASEGQAHVAVAESPSVKEVLASARWWQQAAENVPKVTLPLPGKKGEKAIIGEPHAPYPDQVVRLLSEEWVTNGTRSNKAHGIGLDEVLYLMLRKTSRWEPTARSMLNLTLRRISPLLLGLFAVKHLGDYKRWDDYPEPSRRKALTAVSLLGILLDALDMKKEVYMKEAAFQIGQMLALADVLHKDYCIAVRHDLPNSLIGNAMMPRALDSPHRAIADLADRMRLYIGWAKVAEEASNDGEKKKIAIREARKTLRRYQPLATQLHQLGLPDHCDDLMKAEILLGYLAGPRVEGDQDTNAKEDDEHG